MIEHLNYISYLRLDLSDLNFTEKAKEEKSLPIFYHFKRFVSWANSSFELGKGDLSLGLSEIGSNTLNIWLGLHVAW